MRGLNGTIGIGVFGNSNNAASTVSANTGYPEIFVVANDGDKVFDLTKPAKKVSVILNRKPQIQTTPTVLNADFTHVDNSATITFSADTDTFAGDVIQVIPYY